METIRVGTWTAYPRRNELRSRTATLRLEPRVMEVLVLLAERAGDVVTREELLSVVWAGTFVSDEVVTNAIRELRKALDDDARSPRYIQTLPKKGYRLFAPVTVRRRPRLGVHPRVVLVAAAVLATAVWWRRSVPATVPTSEPLQVTAFDGEESEPALSPDGRRVAFVSSLGGGTVGLYVKAVDGGEPLLLSQAEGEAASPAWSPDGERIAYAHFTWDGSFGHEIRIVSALGGANRRVATSKGQGAYVDWSPDAKVARESRQGVRGRARRDLSLRGRDGEQNEALLTPFRS